MFEEGKLPEPSLEVTRQLLPCILLLETVHGCNLKCPLCVLQDKNYAYKDLTAKMSWDTLKAALDKTFDHVNQYIFHCEGEPLLHRDLWRMVSHVKEETGAICMLDSNGHVDTNFEEAVKSGLDQITIALDGYDQESYEKYRVGGSFERVVNFIGALRAARDKLDSKTPNIRAKVIAFRYMDTLNMGAKMFLMAMQAGADGILTTDATINENFIGQCDIMEWLPKDGGRYDVESLALGDFLKIKDAEPDCRDIMYGRIPPVITWDGNVLPCCYASPYRDDYVMGNINDQEFKEIWLSERYVNFRYEAALDCKTSELCRTCQKAKAIEA